MKKAALTSAPDKTPVEKMDSMQTDSALITQTETIQSPSEPSRAQKEPRSIEIQGARVNTLKNVSCKLPQDKITVITGPSGSGKSSLAFDTLYAEGQRRYIESMSSYARQFLARIEKPDVDGIRHILPAIALGQKNSTRNSRSTVGTATEIYDYVRLLFAHVGHTVCSVCQGDVNRTDPKRILKELGRYPVGTKVLLMAPVSLREVSIEQLIKQGFFRIAQSKAENEVPEMVELASVRDTLQAHDTVRIVIDRLIVREKIATGRLLESIRSALALGHGHMEMQALDGNDLECHAFQNAYACENCHREYLEPFPNLFSFNSPLGACTECQGFGRIPGLDYDKIIPDKTRSLLEGAIHPFNGSSADELYDSLIKEARLRKIPVQAPWQQLTEEQKAFVMEGGGSYEGVNGFFNWLETQKYKMHMRILMARYRGYYPCHVCQGSRLRPEALNVQINGFNILKICETPVGSLLAFIEAIELTDFQKQLAARLLTETENRLRYLQRMGLSYLTLNRTMRTLSNGEAQRINLSAALGGGLTDTLYVLDEPTIGLHARDTDRLIGILQGLRDKGNTLVLVEHDPDMMLAADHIVDMGPSGGSDGGRILFEGSPADLLKVSYSQTARYLNQPDLPAMNGKQSAEKVTSKATKASEPIVIEGATGHNLKNLTVKIPTHCLVCVTGVSGSGKSTLIRQTLFAAYEHNRSRSLALEEAPYDRMSGLEQFEDVLLVDQSPPARSVRSNPITYVKAYDEIRKLFAATRQSKTMGITPGHFSFNTVGGRCETCQGLGTLTIDMQFMADVTVVCPDCQGRRFNSNVLEIEVNGKNIDAILNMTVSEAITFFADYSKICNKLEPLQEIGLSYLKLGQSTSTLSGGEAQRLKLAGYLPGGVTEVSIKQTKKPYLFLFDEPTTGLHMADIALLEQAFRRLLSVGHSVLVIEHNIDFIARCDHIIDLGPEGGTGGGQIVAQGTVKDIMAISDSYTGKFLKQRLNA
jgi:excinuclease ABC subunit A